MYLLDTDVVSELRKSGTHKIDARVEQWSQQVDPARLYISAITVHEIELGVLLKERSDPAQGAVLRRWLNERLLPAFAGRIIAVDERIAIKSASLHVPDPKPYRDTLIAASAMVHRMTMVTRNSKDFSFEGITLINPWQA